MGTGKMTVTHNASVFTDSSHDNLFGSMCVHWPGKKIMGIKWFNMFSRQQQGYPAMNGHVIILSNTENGAPLAALAGTPITDYRTAAGHGTVAAKTLAREDASALAIIGCGSQGAIGLSSIASVLPIRNIFLWSRNPEKARSLQNGPPRNILCDRFRDRHAGAGGTSGRCNPHGHIRTHPSAVRKGYPARVYGDRPLFL